MTTGQLLFLAGAGLLVVTIILGIVFLVKPVKYNPEHAVYAQSVSSGGSGATRPLGRNAYPTDPMTGNQTRGSAAPTEKMREGGGADTESLFSGDTETELLTGSQGGGRGTERISRPGSRTDVLQRPGQGQSTDVLQRPGKGQSTDVLQRPGKGQSTDVLQRPGKGQSTDVLRRPGQGSGQTVGRRGDSTDVLNRP